MWESSNPPERAMSLRIAHLTVSLNRACPLAYYCREAGLAVFQFGPLLIEWAY